MRQWLALMCGLFGIGLVLVPRLTADAVVSITIVNTLFAFGALFGITLGTIYQKAFVTGEDIRTSGVWQFLGATELVGTAAISLETMSIQWTPQFVGALCWLVVVLSLGAISLLLVIIRHGAVSRVATMFYMVPPVTALIAFILFEERLTAIQLVGMAVTAYAVWFGGRKR